MSHKYDSFEKEIQRGGLLTSIANAVRRRLGYWTSNPIQTPSAGNGLVPSIGSGQALRLRSKIFSGCSINGITTSAGLGQAESLKTEASEIHALAGFGLILMAHFDDIWLGYRE
jgi:hypothetical protein